MIAKNRTFWSLVLAAGALTFIVVRFVVPTLAWSPSKQAIQAIFIGGLLPLCRPEPVEQLRFVAAVLLPVALFGAGMLLLRRRSLLARLEAADTSTSVLALLAQLVVAIAGSCALIAEAKQGGSFPFLSVSAMVSLATFMALGLAYFRMPPHRVATVHAAWRAIQRWWWPAWAIALLWTTTFALTGLFRDADSQRWSDYFGYNIPFVLGEFAAALNGRTPLVDFFSQYQNLLPLILTPFFKVAGVSVTTFSALMFSLTVVGFMLLYSALCRVCKSAWSALGLFIPCVALSFVSLRTAPGGYLAGTFSYYAVGPLRYFGLFLLARLSVWYLEKPSLSRLVPVSAIAFFVALNNLDFGVPSAVGVLACAILFPPAFRSVGIWRRLLALTTFLASAGVSLAAYLTLVRIARGAWPTLGNLFLFQKVFAGYGFCMLPAPDIGLYWVVYLTFMASVLIPTYEVFMAMPHDAEQRRLNGVLAYWGIAGMGPLTYYMGRSHSEVLHAVLCAWAFALANLVCRAWILWSRHRNEPNKSGSWLSVIPQVAVVSLFALMVPSAGDVPNPLAQIRRLALPDTRIEPADAKPVALIKKYVHREERTMIVYRDAHWLALKAGVSNVFAFAHPDSIIILPQIDTVVAGLARLPVGREYIFGSLIGDLRGRLEALGFRKLEAVGDFAVWAKPGH